MRFKTEMLIILSVCFSLLILFSTPALCVQYVEDFEDDSNPGQHGFASEVFQHNMLPPEGGQPGDEDWEITARGALRPNVLRMYPAIDEVTFSLNPGEYVDYVGVDFIDWSTGGYTTFEAIGTLGTYSSTTSEWMDPMEPDWPFVDTSQANIGQITMVKLITAEGGFDNLVINVVPEPTTLSLAVVLLLAIAIRQRRLV